MKVIFRRILILSIFIFTATAFSQVRAQEKTITGTVTDSLNHSPLIGVTIRAKNDPKTGTITGEGGKFQLKVPSSVQFLTFSYVGYDSKTVPISDQPLQVKLTSGRQLNELVVVGYGTQKAKDVSTAITKLSDNHFNKGVVTNPIQQVQGKVSGLVITQPGGDPNQNVSIRLRGQASLTGGQAPLIVLDGVPLDDPNIISNIPPDDIVSYNVLKDASAAAIYGSRGANGVIIINTKKGSSGTAKVTYSGLVGISTLAKEYDMLNSPEWKKAAKSVGTDQNTIDNLDKGGNTDWMKAITRTGFTHKHNLSISGGTNDFSYYGSVNYLNQEGIVINSGKKEVGINFNGQKSAFNDKLKIKIGILNTNTDREYVDYSIFPAIYNTPPVYPVYNKDGSYYTFSDFEEFNAVEHQKEEMNSGKEKYNVLHGSIDYSLTQDLTIGVRGSLSYFNKQTDWFKPSFPAEGNFNQATKYDENRNSQKGNIHINFTHDWDQHHLDFTLVHEYSNFIFKHFQASGQQYIVEGNKDNALENGNPQYNDINSYKERYELASFLGRLSYNYAGKYYFNFSYRQDGSSKFGENNRWGSFPAVSVAWRLSEEPFLQKSDWINSIKLRGGYGVTGNQDAIDAYRTQRLLGNLGRYYDAASGSYPLAYGPAQNDNPDLKWEEVHGTNIGLDFILFHHGLTGHLNWYHNKTKNLLYTYTVPVPPFYVNNILANVGSMLNTGFETQLEANIIKTDNFSWSANGQITFLNTKITNLSGTYAGFKVSTNNIRGGVAEGRGLTDYPITFLKVNYAPYVFFLPHYLGVNKDGEQLFSDGKGGKVTQDDLNRNMYHYIDPTPDFNYGFGSTFSYRQWTFNFFLRGISGQKIFDNTRLILDNIVRLPGNNITTEGAKSGIKDAPVPSDLWLENASFLRLEDLTLAYTFNKIPQINQLQLYITANNLFVITPYGGLDPEIRVADSNEAYIDATKGDDGFYPKARSFSFGVKVSF